MLPRSEKGESLTANIELFQHLMAIQTGAKFALLLIVIVIRVWGG